jgi:nucleotide-binding universal stress UspA family protein
MPIVVASDLSFRSAPALARAAQIAERLKDTLHVLHVVADDLATGLQSQAGDWARESLARELAALKLPADPIIAVKTGRAREAVAAYAAECGASLVIVGRHDPHKDGLFTFAESTGGKIMRSTPLPVLLVRNAAPGPYKTIVAGVDCSLYGTAAIRHARRIAPDAALHLVHAYVVPFRSHIGTPGYLGELRANAEQAFADYRAANAGILSGAVTNAVLEGMPYEVLMGEVRRTSADLIAVGTHGGGAVVRAMWGSVASAVIESAETDVLVTHAA